MLCFLERWWFVFRIYLDILLWIWWLYVNLNFLIEMWFLWYWYVSFLVIGCWFLEFVVEWYGVCLYCGIVGGICFGFYVLVEEWFLVWDFFFWKCLIMFFFKIGFNVIEVFIRRFVLFVLFRMWISLRVRLGFGILLVIWVVKYCVVMLVDWRFLWMWLIVFLG